MSAHSIWQVQGVPKQSFYSDARCMANNITSFGSDTAGKGFTHSAWWAESVLLLYVALD
jgi:hypothetical protein